MAESYVWEASRGRTNLATEEREGVKMFIDVHVLLERAASLCDQCVLLLQEGGGLLALVKESGRFEILQGRVVVRVPTDMVPFVFEVRVVHVVQVCKCALLSLLVPHISDEVRFLAVDSMLRRLRDSIVEWRSRREKLVREVVLGWMRIFSFRVALRASPGTMSVNMY